MEFSKIEGQKVIVESLKNAVRNNMISNGYIFSGRKGCGKKLVAYTFAMALNCRESADQKPCGSCSSCIRTKNGNHPNLEIVKPMGQSIKIRQIRSIINEVAKKPFEGGYKVVIIENAEKMTHDAQDAFLKTLEEPPDDTVFILLAENYSLLLPTIISRCQVHRLKPIGTWGFFTDKESFKIHSEYIDILENALTGDRSGVLLQVSEKVGSREEAEKFLEFALIWFRDILVLRENNEGYKDLIINTDNLEALSKHNSVLTEDKLNSIIKIVKKTIMYVKHNVGIKNSIDGMLFNILEVSLHNG